MKETKILKTKIVILFKAALVALLLRPSPYRHGPSGLSAADAAFRAFAPPDCRSGIWVYAKCQFSFRK
jgi:hypothetical protein